MSHDTVPHLDVILYNTGTPYHFRHFMNIRVFRVTILERAKARKRHCSRTQTELTSRSLALLIPKTDVLKFTAVAESCTVCLCVQGVTVTIWSPKIS
jgi:hypothetical protein